MPRLLVEACRREGIEPFVVALEGQSDFVWLPDDVDHEFVRMGRVGAVLKALRAAEARDVVMIGSIRKPPLYSLAPDFKAIQLILRHGYTALGDDGALKALRGFLEREGFALHGMHHFMPEIVTPQGVLGSVQPLGDIEIEIEIGVRAALEWGAQDKGQAVIVHDGQVVAREARDGTDAMIKAHGCVGAVLVKMCKPQQDRDLDLPTIGISTVQNAVEAGLAGIVVHAGASFFVNREEAINLADEAGIFIVGVTP